MKILIIVNNHSSLNLIDLSLRLSAEDKAISIYVLCEKYFISGVFNRYSNVRNLSIEEWGAINPNVLESKKKLWLCVLQDSLIKILIKLQEISFFKIALYHLESLSLGSMLRERYIVKRIESGKQQALTIIDKIRPQTVLSMSDRTHDYLESCTLWAARKKGIRIILPYLAHYDKDNAIGYRLDSNGKIKSELSPHSRPSLYKYIALRVLKNCLYKGVFFQPPFVLWAHKKSNTLSSYPWWVGNGFSNIVCVNSQHSLEEYKKNCVPNEKLIIVGDVYYDQIFKTYCNKNLIKNKFVKEFNLDANKPVIILALPQYLEQGYLNTEQHWEKIGELMTQIVSMDANILVSLHPRMNAKNYAFIEEKYSCLLVRERLADFISIADVFVSSPSSTVVWAALCGIPSVVIDIFSYNKDFYAYLQSVKVIEKFDKLKDVILESLKISDHFFEADWQVLSRDKVFNGNVINQYKNIIFETSFINSY